MQMNSLSHHHSPEDVGAKNSGCSYPATKMFTEAVCISLGYLLRHYDLFLWNYVNTFTSLGNFNHSEVNYWHFALAILILSLSFSLILIPINRLAALETQFDIASLDTF
jgi:hypothetical protein